MKDEHCITVSFFADLMLPTGLITLTILAHNIWAIIICFCAVFAYLYFFVPLKVCFGLESIRITSIFGFEKKTIKWSEIRSLHIEKTANPSLPIQFLIMFNQGKGIKRQSFGLNKQSKIIGLIKVFKIYNVTIHSNGHGMVDYYINQANDDPDG